MDAVKPKFYPKFDFVGNQLDTAFSQGVKTWLDNDCTVTDGWFVSFPKYSKKMVIVEIKLDDGKAHFSLALGQYLLFKELVKRDIEILYIFQSSPENLNIRYWWLDPTKQLHLIEVPYKYFLLPKDITLRWSLPLIKSVMLNKVMPAMCKLCLHQKGLPAIMDCNCSCHH